MYTVVDAYNAYVTLLSGATSTFVVMELTFLAPSRMTFVFEVICEVKMKG